jgi:hypothetical protein
MNLLTTIPKSAYRDWETCERVCRRCDGETEWDGSLWFWLINCQNLPTKIDTGESVCFMIYDGFIRGYFHIVDTDKAIRWHRHKEKHGKPRTGFVVVMATWRPITPIPHTGFQGYRYTELRP